MNPQPDTFLAFIDDLAADLDDHESSADERAARHFLSRSHFDRVISATAGEPPAAFRRRILMERAAFRLATGNDGILRLAVEAGYSSHEAFTRAFERAYGVAPSAWRARPSRIQIASPNDVHFHPPGGLRLPATSEDTTMNLLVRMVEHHLWLVGEMVDRAAKLDDATLDRPITLSVEALDPGATTRRLLSRLVGQIDMWRNVINGRDYDMSIEAHEPIADLRRRLDIAGPAFLAEVRRVVEGGRLDETFVDAYGDKPEVFTYGGLIAHVLTFAAARRILVLGAFESAGITDLGNGDPRLWVADAA
ncbi:MAG TPA: helix-turn-helix transcriptional regulator [Candidatus Limnocylindrales bacterium]|nr:helix-turn-helix transcriptional regulator [Candidatus Limnocylindrales bacterium]